MGYSLRTRMTPDQVSAVHGRVLYRCTVCDAVKGLRWYAGTCRPVCSKPECAAALRAEDASQK